MNFKEEGQDKWNKAYSRGGNIVFYPHEEIIRFVNKYIRKRLGVNEFKNIMKLSDNEWNNFTSLDLGCGIGRHIIFLEEFGLNPSGIDLSDKAISEGKHWFNTINKGYLADKITVGSVAELPYDNESFNICISHGVLDSMPRDIAKRGISEVYRVLKKRGIMYLDLIMNTEIGNNDVEVQSGYEKGTIQSYFTVDSIKEFIGDKVEIIEFKIISRGDENGIVHNRRAHLVIQKIKHEI